MHAFGNVAPHNNPLGKLKIVVSFHKLGAYCWDAHRLFTVGSASDSSGTVVD